ncbi:MAG: hypothetical protein II481_03640 [Clostridia bacterium]|nr:hypothetical protein [Clostridia bacterium]
MADLDVYAAISEINALIEGSRKVPLSNMIMVDRNRLEDLLDRLHDSFGPDLEKAKTLLDKEQELRRRWDEHTEEAERNARETIDKATEQAHRLISDADVAAKDTQRKATDYANQTVAGAQAEAQNIIQMAQAQAAQLVEENEITQRAQARAAEINDDAMQACNRMQQDTVARLARLLEDADGGLATQLDAVRTMRQQLQMGGYADSDQGGYGPVEYGE